ncbi:LysR family transcriptional regulator [Chloroflexia bacterium SDU3-3]|nr:LysR family transcriptional regulator [Chloroflexia bacterium SDU3-3]
MPRHRTNLDLEALRSFVMGVELGSFAMAAERLSRSPSTLSGHLRRLEQQAGAPLFERAGRGLALTAQGEALLGYARRMLALNDEALDALRGADLRGGVRLGVQEDFAEGLLAEVLARFGRTHSGVRLEVRVARNADLAARLAAGQLDLALLWGQPPDTAQVLRELPMAWIVGERATPPPGDAPLPLALFDTPCQFRTAATAALDSHGLAWRAALTSPSLAGLWAATAAGIGITARTRLGLPAGVRALAPGERGLPALPRIALALRTAEDRPPPAVARLASILRESASQW